MRKRGNMLTAERLREVLHYCPETGEFTIKVSRGSRTAPVGAKTGTINKNGYVVIGIDSKVYYAHRLAWLYMTGEWPSSREIDHRDLDRSNNKWINLRQASSSQNKGNKKVRMDSRSGIKGVMISRNGKGWVVRAARRHIGTFYSIEDSRAAYDNEARNFFGEFTR